MTQVDPVLNQQYNDAFALWQKLQSDAADKRAEWSALQGQVQALIAQGPGIIDQANQIGAQADSQAQVVFALRAKINQQMYSQTFQMA
jgi:hypothetical protein